MKLNRRNVLVGLGTIVASGGAALGTGAFSQVDADRTVNITMAGDSGGLLELSIDTNYNGISDGSGTDNGTNGEDIIQINLNDINDNAVTTFDNALTIENNGSNPVDLSIDDSKVDGVTFTLNDTLVTANNDDNNEDQTTADIEVDTSVTISSDDVTITAEDNS